MVAPSISFFVWVVTCYLNLFGLVGLLLLVSRVLLQEFGFWFVCVFVVTLIDFVFATLVTLFTDVLVTAY